MTYQWPQPTSSFDLTRRMNTIKVRTYRSLEAITQTVQSPPVPSVSCDTDLSLFLGRQHLRVAMPCLEHFFEGLCCLLLSTWHTGESSEELECQLRITIHRSSCRQLYRGLFLIDWWLVWECPDNYGWCHVLQVDLGCVREYAKPDMENNAVSSSPPWCLPHSLHTSGFPLEFCPALPQ